MVDRKNYKVIPCLGDQKKSTKRAICKLCDGVRCEINFQIFQISICQFLTVSIGTMSALFPAWETIKYPLIFCRLNIYADRFYVKVIPCVEDHKISVWCRKSIGVGHRANSPTFPKERLKIKARGRSRTCVPIEQPTSGTKNL